MVPLAEKWYSFVKRVAQTDIVKVFSFTSLSTLVKMATGLISVKIVAAIIGPAGVALVGQLQNFATVIMSLASGGINNGIVKYVSEFKTNTQKISVYIAVALKITIICSLITGVAMILFHRALSLWIMLSPEYGYIFIIFGFTVLLYALNSMFISVINGFKEFKKYVKINIANSIVGLIFTIILVITLGLHGALISAVTYQSIMFFITLLMIRDMPLPTRQALKEQFDRVIASQYFRYSLMALTSAAVVPVSQMLLRTYVITHISPVEAGWWEGMNRISNMYLMVITSSFGVYYLPRLSELSDSRALKHEIFKAYKVIVPMMLAGFGLIYFMRYVVIRVLYTADFMPMANLFIWQLAGDFFKICSWLLAFLMIAKSMTKTFITTEVVFSLMYVGLGLAFVRYSGNVVGLNQAYLINYIIYTLCMCVMFRKIIIS